MRIQVKDITNDRARWMMGLYAEVVDVGTPHSKPVSKGSLVRLEQLVADGGVRVVEAGLTRFATPTAMLDIVAGLSSGIPIDGEAHIVRARTINRELYGSYALVLEEPGCRGLYGQTPLYAGSIVTIRQRLAHAYEVTHRGETKLLSYQARVQILETPPIETAEPPQTGIPVTDAPMGSIVRVVLNPTTSLPTVAEGASVRLMSEYNEIHLAVVDERNRVQYLHKSAIVEIVQNVFHLADLKPEHIGRTFIVASTRLALPVPVGTLVQLEGIGDTTILVRWDARHIRLSEVSGFALQLQPDEPLPDSAIAVGAAPPTEVPALLHRDAILATLGEKWTIVDPLFCTPMRDEYPWVHQEDGAYLYLLQNDGARAIIKPAQRDTLSRLRNLRGLSDRYQTINAQWSYTPGPLLRVCGLQEQAGMFSGSTLIYVTHDVNHVMVQKELALADAALKDSGFTWRTANFAGGLLEHQLRPLTQLEVGASFQVLFQGVDGWFVAKRKEHGVSEWGTILCELRHPVLGFTEVRLEDLRVVLPLTTHCTGCDLEFDVGGREVVLGVRPHEHYTGQCADCFTSAMAAGLPTPPDKPKVYFAPPERKAPEPPWAAWASPSWEEP